MKKILAIVTILAVSVSFVSCDNKQEQLEEKLIRSLRVPSSYKVISFEKINERTIELECLEQETRFLQKYIDYDIVDYEKTYRKIAAYRIKNEGKLNKPTSTEYELIYEAKNALGIPLAGKCYARYDENGKMVAYNLSDDGSIKKWEYISVPFPKYNLFVIDRYKIN